MPYLPQADIDELVNLLAGRVATTDTWVDAWLVRLPAAYRNSLPGADTVKHRLELVLGRVNAAAPLAGGVVPLTVLLEALVQEPEETLSLRGKQLLDRMGPLGAAGGVSLQQVFEEARLVGSVLFADRSPLRARFRELLETTAAPAVLVNGKEKTGKSHTRKLLAHVAQKTNQFRVAWVEIEKEQAPSFTPDWLIEELVRSVVPDAPASPPRREPPARWLGELVSWALSQLSRLDGRPVWLVIDGLRLDGIHPHVLGLAQRLATSIATANGMQLRLVLIDCDPVSILRTGCAAEEEVLGHLTIDDARHLLELLLGQTRLAEVWPGVQAKLGGGTPTTLAVSDAVAGVL